MCDICNKHGDGNKWYFNPKNYSREMGEARKEYLEKLAGASFGEWIIDDFEIVERFKNVPLLGKLAMNLGKKYSGHYHGGQIIPLNDLLKVVELCENPAILPCECREIVGQEGYQCLNMGLLPELYKKANPDIYIEELSVNKTKKVVSKWNKEGLYHLILWTKVPYVTTVCNCTAPICTAYKGRRFLGFKNNLIKGEYVCNVDESQCDGCKICLTRCPFGAILFDLDRKKAFVDINTCFGCGLCEAECKQKAIKLIDRKLTPAKNLW